MMTESTITELLASKHNKDIFIPQCNHGAGHQTMRMDAWTMAKSWAHPCYCAYEIKVSRSDFLQDEKYRHYMKFCNQFYFVCPAKLIDPSELPSDCGLMWVSSTGTRLYTKKKAPYRKIEEPVGVLHYVLMWRTSVLLRGNNPSDTSSYTFWRDWLDNKQKLAKCGHKVSKRLGKLIHEEIDAVENENRSLKKQVERLQAVENKCEELGINIHTWNIDREIRDKLAAICSDGIDKKIGGAITELTNLRRALAEVATRQPGQPPEFSE